MLSRDKILRSENKLAYFLCRDGVTYLKLKKKAEIMKHYAFFRNFLPLIRNDGKRLAILRL